MEYLEEIREKFKNDRFATGAAGIVIDSAAPGTAVCGMDIKPCHMNALGRLMGGAVFTLADFAFAVATNGDGSVIVSQTGQITYLSSPRGKRLIAEAENVRTGRSTCFYVIHIRDECGTDVAHVTMTGFVKSKKGD